MGSDQKRKSPVSRCAWSSSLVQVSSSLLLCNVTRVTVYTCQMCHNIHVCHVPPPARVSPSASAWSRSPSGPSPAAAAPPPAASGDTAARAACYDPSSGYPYYNKMQDKVSKTWIGGDLEIFLE